MSSAESGWRVEPATEERQRWVLEAPTLVNVDRSVPPGGQPADLARYCLMLGDDALILSQRLLEWGHRAPELEEDLALATIALDLLAQSRVLLTRAGEIEADGRDEDRLAYFREHHEFFNVRLVEIDCGPGPGGDFAATIARLLLFAEWRRAVFARLTEVRDPVLAALGARSRETLTRHRDHAVQWTIRLGDATEESRTRMDQGLRRVWPMAGELFVAHPVEARLAEAECAVDPATVRDEVLAALDETLSVARLDLPDVAILDSFTGPAGRDGAHTETMEFLLAEMQYIARSDPAASR